MSENTLSRAIRGILVELVSGITPEIDSLLDSAYGEGLIGPDQRSSGIAPSTLPSSKARLLLDAVERRVRIDPSAYQTFLKLLEPQFGYLATMLEDKRRELSSGEDPQAKAVERSEQVDSGAVVDPSLSEEPKQDGLLDVVPSTEVQHKLETQEPALRIPAQESNDSLPTLCDSVSSEPGNQAADLSGGACGSGDPPPDTNLLSPTDPPPGGIFFSAYGESAITTTAVHEASSFDDRTPVEETNKSYRDVVRERVHSSSRPRLMSGDGSSSEDPLDDMEDAVRAGAAKMRSKMKQRKHEVVASNKKIEELEREVIARHHSEETLQAELAEQKRENERLEVLLMEKTMESARIKHKHSNEVKALRSELTEKDEEVDSCKTQVAQMEKDHAAKITDLEGLIQTLEEERTAMKTRNASVQKHHENEINKLEQELVLKKAEVVRKENERDSIHIKLEKMEVEYEKKMLAHEREIDRLNNSQTKLEIEKLTLQLRLKDMEHEKQLDDHRMEHEKQLDDHRMEHEKQLDDHRKNSVPKEMHEKVVLELKTQLSLKDLPGHVNVAELSKKFKESTI